jgi:hypothetical protein
MIISNLNKTHCLEILKILTKTLKNLNMWEYITCLWIESIVLKFPSYQYVTIDYNTNIIRFFEKTENLIINFIGKCKGAKNNPYTWVVKNKGRNLNYLLLLTLMFH